MLRSPRNSDRPASRVPGAMNIVEKGIFNFITSIGAGKNTDDAWDLMLVVAGRAVLGDGMKRVVFLAVSYTHLTLPTILLV
eukprot:7257226-Pyramimonas_sp.AAC.1